MPFSKRYPKVDEKTLYTRWEEVYLDENEEEEIERTVREKNNALMKACINDARAIITETELKPFQTNIVQVAIALFEKRASHVVFHKENKTKEKFDRLQKQRTQQKN